jgi:hypothetical protein
LGSFRDSRKREQRVGGEPELRPEQIKKAKRGDLLRVFGGLDGSDLIVKQTVVS